MSIFSILSQKPWTSDQAKIDDKHSGKSSSMPLPRVALYVSMVVMGVLFTLFSVAYIGRMAYGDWRVLPEPLLLWFNSLVILMSSFAFHRANLSSKEKNNRNGDIRIFITDNKKIKNILGWEPTLSTKTIVNDTFKWIIDNKKVLESILK